MTPKILVPYDYSSCSERALAWAADFQKTTGAEPIQMIHAIDSRPAGAGAGEATFELLLPNDDEIAGLERSMREAALRHGSQASARVLVLPHPVGDTILGSARDSGVEVIVMGTHGRSGVRRVFLGSVAEHVLRHAECPVVTIRTAGDSDGREVSA